MPHKTSRQPTTTDEIFEQRMKNIVSQMNLRVEEATGLQFRDAETMSNYLETLQDDYQDMKLQMTAMMHMLGRHDLLTKPTPVQASNAMNTSVKRCGEQMKAEAKTFVPFGGLTDAAEAESKPFVQMRPSSYKQW